MDGFDPQTVFDFLSTSFNLPAEWFASPVSLVFYIIIPIVSMAILWSVVLNNKIRIFNNEAANIGIGIMIAVTNIPILNSVSPALVAAIGIGGSIGLSGETMRWAWIGGGIMVAILILSFYPAVVAMFEGAAAGYPVEFGFPAEYP